MADCGAAHDARVACISLREAPMFACAGLLDGSDERVTRYARTMPDDATRKHDIHDRWPVILNTVNWGTCQRRR